jgi:cell shape-determining protein MreD
LFATWGSFAWAGYLFHALPLFGKTRLQSRNIVIANVAEAVLLAWVARRLFSRRREEAAVTGWRRYVVAAPAFVVLVLSALVVLFPVGTEQALGAGPNKTLARDLWPILLVHSVLALIVLVAVLRPPSRPARRSVLVAVVALDVLAFNVFANVGLAGGHVTFMPTRESAVATLGDNGRYARSIRLWSTSRPSNRSACRT